MSNLQLELVPGVSLDIPMSPTRGVAQTPQMKECRKCRRRLALSQFNKHRSTDDGVQSWCRDCQQAYMRQYNVERAQQKRIAELEKELAEIRAKEKKEKELERKVAEKAKEKKEKQPGWPTRKQAREGFDREYAKATIRRCRGDRRRAARMAGVSLRTFHRMMGG